MIRILESASESIVPDDISDNSIISSQISLNIKGEWDAIEGYNKLISLFNYLGDNEAISIIEEIISDEKNHAMKLEGLLKKYDGNIEMAND